MSVKVKTKKGKTYVLKRDEFMRFMKTLWERAQAQKAFREDKEEEEGEE